MGSRQSVRATHFQRPNTTATDPLVDEIPDDHHISISNKMVERLVEDATLAGGAAAVGGAGTPRGDYKDKIYMEKLKCLDESHSERCGELQQIMFPSSIWSDYRRWALVRVDSIDLKMVACLSPKKLRLTVEDLKAIATRIELRTANMVSVEPVCADCKERVIECFHYFDQPAEAIKCWDTIGVFTKCVQDAATTRLRARTQKEARDNARRSRHMAHAREHALRDLGPPPYNEQTTTA